MNTAEMRAGLPGLMARIPDGKLLETVGDCVVFWVHQDEYVIVGPAWVDDDPDRDPIAECISTVLRFARRTWFCKFESHGDFVLARLYAAT